MSAKGLKAVWTDVWESPYHKNYNKAYKNEYQMSKITFQSAFWETASVYIEISQVWWRKCQ